MVVTALHYVPQINSLLVGFNFGSFQIYNLTDLSLDHSNPYSKISAPVVDFIYQVCMFMYLHVRIGAYICISVMSHFIKHQYYSKMLRLNFPTCACACVVCV